jgi:hypothetical protein
VQGQLATYKEMAAAAEADRGRLEAEVLATAQLVTAIEARLRAALAAKDAAEARAASAEMRMHEVSVPYFLSCVCSSSLFMLSRFVDASALPHACLKEPDMLRR